MAGSTLVLRTTTMSAQMSLERAGAAKKARKAAARTRTVGCAALAGEQGWWVTGGDGKGALGRTGGHGEMCEAERGGPVGLL